MTAYLSLEDVLAAADEIFGHPAEIRDLGLLDSAGHRPQASMFGADAYPDLPTKAAALLESLARNHPLVDGNKRLAWAATVVFLLDNGLSLLEVDQDEAYDFVIAVAEGRLELAVMASWLATHAKAVG
ncbi:type II toxin-antitoxin system death-on-curing family toxin [Jiangella gansuensis]|uniref:type II toxin-antitoxin system death-on-curing family toxin n=1 Tax=Jiangella gansuensis TaxID=281473 RepID=UPI00047C8F71|nr:type II toxin-antitoxin system death-on-curing family toxin [Jiangella gansuensis]